MSFKTVRVRQRKADTFKDIVHKTRSKIRVKTLTYNRFFKYYGDNVVAFSSVGDSNVRSPFEYFFIEMWDDGVSHNFNEGFDIVHPFRNHIINKKRKRRR